MPFLRTASNLGSTTMIAALLLSGLLAHGQDVPPPPKPADDGPSLEATMKFVQEKLGSIGRLNYIAYGHDNIAGDDWMFKFSGELTNVRASVAACRIDNHWQATLNGQAVEDRDWGLSLKDVQEVVVKTMEQEFKEGDTKAGYPEWSMRVDPPVFLLLIKGKRGERLFEQSFVLYDESLGNRVAKALVHAIELCGGGSKDPF
jgi:hypothetical protein